MCCFRKRNHFNIILGCHIFHHNRKYFLGWLKFGFKPNGQVALRVGKTLAFYLKYILILVQCIIFVFWFMFMVSRLWSLIHLWLCVSCILSLCILGLDWDCLFMCHFCAALQPVSKRFEEYFSLLNFMVLENVVRNVIIKWYFSTNCFWTVLWCSSSAFYVYLLVDCGWRFFHYVGA